MKPKIVVVGGGTGSHTLLSGLKALDCDLFSIVTVADSGGSTGRLRDEFGYLPMGDFRMSLVGMAQSDPDAVMRKLFMYRFDRGEQGLRGHNFGNLMLVALTDILKSEEKAFEYASHILNVKGTVLPVTTSQVTLMAEYENGEILEGEASIDYPPSEHDGTLHIKRLFLKDPATISDAAKAALLNADYIIISPGDLYTSILANVVVSGVSEAISHSHAKLIYISNLMSKWGQTYNFKTSNYLHELKKYISRVPDIVLINNAELPEDILESYSKENNHKVINDLESNEECSVICVDLLADEKVRLVSGDLVKRSLIRHSPEKLSREISKIIFTDEISNLQSGMSDLANMNMII